MRTSVLTFAFVIVVATASPTANAVDPATTYSPTRDTPLQRFTAPEDSARPGETFFYRAANAAAKGNHEFAAEMYRVSASWAYKPAQYDLGVMYFNGEGVPVDHALGMAWLALAAERDEDKDYGAARDLAYTKMSGAEFERANELWRDLRKTYGDDVALMRAKNRWLQVRRAATGSHLGEGTGHLTAGGRDVSGMNVNGKFKANTSTQTAFGITGAGAVDGSAAYSRLRTSDSPYDVKLKQPTGIATVKDIIPIGDGVPRSTEKDPKRFY